MPILAMSAGTVTAVWGNAFVRLPNGSLKPVQVGDKVKGGERIITDEDGIVEISPAKGHAVLVKAAVAPEAVNKAIAGIENQDPEQAPAAGLTGGADGGMQPGLRVDRVSESVGQLAFEFGAGREQASPSVASSADQRLLATSVSQASINDVDVNEAVGSATFTITLDRPSANPVTIQYTTQPGTASDGDFTPTSGTVTFNPGETSKTVSVPIKNELGGDAIYEGAEQFTVKLSAPTNAVLAKDTGVGTIHDDGTGSVPTGATPDDDRPHVVSVSDAQATEGGDLAFHVQVSNSSTSVTTVTLKLSGLGDHPATPGVDTAPEIKVAVGGGEPLPAQIDADGNIIFPLPAFTSAATDIVVYVSTKTDGVVEGTEALQLSVTTPYDAVAPSNTGTAIIEDADAKPYMLVLNGEPAVEGDPVGFNVVLTHASATPVTVKLALADGVDDPDTPENEGATLGDDTGTQLQYETASGEWVDVPASGLLTFEPGQTLLHTRVATKEDADPESTEYIKLEATVVEGDTLNGLNVPTSNQTAIVDNDQPPTDAPYMLVQHGISAIEGSPVEFHVVLTHATTEAVTVKLALANSLDASGAPVSDGALIGVDTGTQLEYEAGDGSWMAVPSTGLLTFDPGHTELHVRVATVDDEWVEGIEYAKLVAEVVEGTTQNGLHVPTSNLTAITDNDPAPVDAPQAQVSATGTMIGGSGSDVFAWHLSDHDASGAPAGRAVDTIQGFDAHAPSAGGDVLDLRDLLQGENTTGGTGNLDHYLQFDTSGSNAIIKVAPTGDFVPGDPGAGTASQHIVLEGGHLLSDLGLDAGASNVQIIAKLLQQGNLLVDHA